MQVGKMQILRVTEKTDSGFFLQDNDGVEAFLPKLFADADTDLASEIEVFIYQDGNELLATTERPFCEVGEFAVVTAVESLPIGSFMDWGISKDLFIPYREQKGKILEGKRYLVYVYIDEETGLITGTTKYKRNTNYENLPFKKGDKVDLIMMNETDFGWNVVINKQYVGLIYADDVVRKLYPFNEEVGYIKAIREDGKIDVMTQPQGFENIDVFRQAILNALDKNDGVVYLSDKSSPEEISEELNMSKKNFKKAIGGLYKDGIIEILVDKIRLK